MDITFLWRLAMKRLAILSTAALIGVGSMAATEAQAQYRRSSGGAVAAGVIGGLAAGALLGAYAAPGYVYGGYGPVEYDYGYAPAVGSYGHAPMGYYGYAPAPAYGYATRDPNARNPSRSAWQQNRGQSSGGYWR
jgi:hypothetical protein